MVRETAESTKIRIVYDASTRGNVETPSLNDCLETGPPLPNKVWSVLVRNRFQPVALAGNLKQAFLESGRKTETANLHQQNHFEKQKDDLVNVETDLIEYF